MVKIKNIFTFFSIMILMVACCPCKKAVTTTESKTSDSLSVEDKTTIKDSLSFTHPAAATVTVFVPCPDVKPVSTKNKNAVSTLEIKNGIATADCFCDSLPIISRTINKERSAFKSHLKEDKTTKVIPTRFVPDWVKILAWIGALSIFYYAFRIYKFFTLKLK